MSTRNSLTAAMSARARCIPPAYDLGMGSDDVEEYHMKNVYILSR